MSPMWLTSNKPTPPRTALCSATRPPVAGYSTGMSQPPKSTIFAPRARCTAFRGVLRSDAAAESTKYSPGFRSLALERFQFFNHRIYQSSLVVQYFRDADDFGIRFVPVLLFDRFPNSGNRFRGIP